MVLKFLGIGKKSEFVLEAPPADSQPAAKAKPADPEKAHVEAKAVLAPTVEQLSEATSKSKVVETAKKEAKAVKEEAKAGLAPVAEKISEATSKVSETTSKVKNTLKGATTEKKAKAGKGRDEKKGAQPAVPAIPAPKPEPTLTNFATTLQPNNTPRRRPGPSLDIFRDMAKQVNSRK